MSTDEGARAPLLEVEGPACVAMATTPPNIIDAPTVCMQCTGTGSALAHPKATVVVRGAIASGKSTLMEELAKFTKTSEVIVLSEPVDMFQEVGVARDNLLEVYYADAKRWALIFQVHALHSRIAAWRKGGVCFSARDDANGPIVIVERSLEGDHVFAQVQREHGNMSDLEFGVYTNAFATASALAPRMTADLTVLMDTPASVCRERMAERGRSEEIGGTEDPDRVEKLATYYQSVWDTTVADVARIESSGRPVMRVPHDWAATPQSKYATLKAISTVECL